MDSIQITYSAIYSTFIFILLLLYLSNTESIGFLLLFAWTICAHSFFFSQITEQFFRIVMMLVSILLILSLTFVAFYIGNKTETVDTVFMDYTPHHAEKPVRDIYKIVFLVCECVCLLLFGSRDLQMLSTSALISTPAMKEIFTIFTIFALFILFIFLYFILTYNGPPDFRLRANVSAFYTSYGIGLVFLFLPLLIYYIFHRVLFINITNVIQILLLYSTLCMSFYCFMVGIWLYLYSR